MYFGHNYFGGQDKKYYFYHYYFGSRYSAPVSAADISGGHIVSEMDKYQRMLTRLQQDDNDMFEIILLTIDSGVLN